VRISSPAVSFSFGWPQWAESSNPFWSNFPGHVSGPKIIAAFSHARFVSKPAKWRCDLEHRLRTDSVACEWRSACCPIQEKGNGSVRARRGFQFPANQCFRKEV
jgi:hypothetical protein